MSTDDGLTHDLNQLRGTLCRCRECDDRRTDLLMLDLVNYYCNTVEEVEAKRKGRIQ